jgi:hypothetical protein
LVPLPWIFKSFRKRTIKDAAPQSFALPAFDVSKLVFISITTIYIFFFAAQTFFLINVYFLCILLAQCLDFLWYISLTKVKPPKNPRVLTEAAFKNIENCQETLNQKLTKMIVNKMKSITKHRAIQEPSDITAVKKAAGILEAVLNEQLSKLTTHNANRADEFRKKVPGLLRKWQEYIKAKAQIESEVRVRNEGSLIAAWKLFSCLAVLSLQLPFHSRIRPSIILLIIAMGILSHIANIAYDYWRNHDEYYSTLMLLYKPHAPQNFSPLGNDTGVLLTDITREP